MLFSWLDSISDIEIVLLNQHVIDHILHF